MIIFYEILKSLFFVATIIVGVLLTSGELAFGNSTYERIKSIIFPGYLLLCGIIIGYLIIQIHCYTQEEDIDQKKYVQGYIIGTIIGIVLATTYILV